MSTSRDPHGHPAIRKAVELYDDRGADGRLRDLTAVEQQFLTDVHQIGRDHTATCGEANRSFGTDSKAALAVEFAANQRRCERYTAALERYEREREAVEEFA